MKVKTNVGILECELIKRNALTVWVRLPDGNVIKRKLKDVVSD